MLNNSKFQKFFEEYAAISDASEAMARLKTFMFSLPNDELMDFMLDTGKAHNEAVKQALANPNLTDADKQKFRAQFDTLLSTFTQPVAFTQAA